MFGKKKRLAKQAAEQAAAQAAARALAEEELKKAQAIEDAKAIGEEKVFVESELCDDDDFDSTKEYEAIAYILKQEEGEALHAESLDDQAPTQQAVEQKAQPQPTQKPAQAQTQQPVQPQPAQQPVVHIDEELELEEIEEEVEEVEEVEEDNAVQDNAPVVNEEAQEEVVYVVEGEEEDDEIVKPAKLVKLPNLIDYMLMQNMTKRMKLNIATLLLSAYQKYKDIPQEKAIIVKCMSKVMASLLQTK